MTEIVQIIPTGNPADELRIIARRMAGLTPAAQSTIEASIRHEIARNFDSESAGGENWAPLNPKTVADRIRHGFPGAHPILRRTGEYRRSWTQSGATEVEQGATGWTMYVGSNSFKAIHEKDHFAVIHGKTYPVPGRPARFVDDGGLNRIAQTVENVLAALVENA